MRHFKCAVCTNSLNPHPQFCEMGAVIVFLLWMAELSYREDQFIVRGREVDSVESGLYKAWLHHL